MYYIDHKKKKKIKFGYNDTWLKQRIFYGPLTIIIDDTDSKNKIS